MKTRKKYFKKGSKRKHFKKGSKRKLFKKRSRIKTVKRGSRRKIKQKKLKIKNFRDQKGGMFGTIKDGVGDFIMRATGSVPSPPPSPEKRNIPFSQKMDPEILQYYKSKNVSFCKLTGEQEFGIGSLISPDGITCEFCKADFKHLTGYEDRKICKIIKDKKLIDAYDDRKLTLLEKKYIHTHFFYHIHKDNMEATDRFTDKLDNIKGHYPGLENVVLPDKELYEGGDTKESPEELTPPTRKLKVTI